MKTLDEVIKAFEICDETVTANCPDCPYDIDCENVPGEDLRTDALHYLREYKKYNDTMCALPDYYEWVHSTDNPPLTWQELQRMECKPVYVVYHTMRTKGWALVEYADDERIDFTTPSAMRLTVFERQMGKTWQAYRRELK